jgi:membrane protease YdiL (CAAX protease family)
MSYIDYAERGRNAPWRYVVGLVGAVLAAILGGAAIVVVLTLLHLFPADFVQNIQDAGRPERFYPANGVAFGLVLLALVLMLHVLHGKTFRDVVGAWSWRRFGQGVAIWSVLLIVSALIDFLIRPAGFRLTASRQTLALAAAAIGGLSIQTFVEEFVFRGYITQGLMVALRRPLPAAVISGALFGAMHIPNGAPQAISATVFGVALALIAIRSGGIAFSYGLHSANNLFGAVVLVSSGDAFRGSPGLVTQSTPDLMWWDVGIGFVCLTIVTAAVLRSRPGLAEDPSSRLPISSRKKASSQTRARRA